MKTTSIILPAVLVSGIVLSGCTNPLADLRSKLPFFGKSSDAPQGTLEMAAEAGKISLMVATGKSGKCVITDSGTGSTMEMFLKGKKMKFSGQDMGPTAENTMYTDGPAPTKAKTVGFFLNDGEYTYIWEQGAKTGIKTKLMAEPTSSPDNQGSDSQSPSELPTVPEFEKFEQDTNYTINCDLTELPDSEFMPPADVEFMDFSALSDDMERYAKELQNSAPGQSEGSMGNDPGLAPEGLPEDFKLPEDLPALE